VCIPNYLLLYHKPKCSFAKQVFDESGNLHLNLTSDEPSFSIHALEPGKTYVIRISSYNEKGRSPPVSLSASTSKVAEKRMGECLQPTFDCYEFSQRVSITKKITNTKSEYFLCLASVLLLNRCICQLTTHKYYPLHTTKEFSKYFFYVQILHLSKY